MGKACCRLNPPPSLIHPRNPNPPPATYTKVRNFQNFRKFWKKKLRASTSAGSCGTPATHQHYSLSLETQSANRIPMEMIPGGLLFASARLWALGAGRLCGLAGHAARKLACRCGCTRTCACHKGACARHVLYFPGNVVFSHRVHMSLCMNMHMRVSGLRALPEA